MLNPNKILTYIKDTLGFPHVTIEKSDEQIKNYIDMFTLLEFSRYIPDTNVLKLDKNDPKAQTNQQNVFLLYDPDGCDILNVKSVPPQIGDYLIAGLPYPTPMPDNYEDIPSTLSKIEKGETTYLYSNAYLSFEFMPPNRLRLHPADTISDVYAVNYERTHPDHYGTIPAEYQTLFLNMALADIMISCGNIRNKYQNISTPFGQVPLDTDLLNAGRTMKENVIQQLDKYHPNCMIYVG